MFGRGDNVSCSIFKGNGFYWTLYITKTLPMPKANYSWVSLGRLIIMGFQIHTLEGVLSPSAGPAQLVPGWHSIHTIGWEAAVFFISRVLPLERTLTTNSFLTTHSLTLSVLTLRKSH